MADDPTTSLVNAFNRAWNDHDLDRALSLVTDDCVFESTAPAPDGETFEGKDALARAWDPVFADLRSHFDLEDMALVGDTVVQRWRYTWGDGHVRGVDVITVRDGLIAAKRSYVKG